MLYTSPNSLRRNGTSDTRRDYTISTDYQDTRQPLISRRREKDSKNIMSVL
jgi:hypothetical protein